jgi:hypothetical protein
MQRRQCETDPRSPAGPDLLGRLVDYVAGYTDAQTDTGPDD